MIPKVLLLAWQLQPVQVGSSVLGVGESTDVALPEPLPDPITLGHAERAREGGLDPKVTFCERQEAVAIGVPARVELRSLLFDGWICVTLIVDGREKEAEIRREILTNIVGSPTWRPALGRAA